MGDKVFKLIDTDEWRPLTDFVEKMLFELSALVYLATWNDDVGKALTGRSKLIWEEANKRGIKMQQVKVFGKPIESYRAIIKGKKVYFQSLPIPPWLKQKGYLWLDDKYLLHEALAKAGINAPKSYKVSNFKEAKDAFGKLTKPVIIKPKNGSRGRHTTTNINTESELKDAFNLSRQITLSTVIQEHLFGSVYRATVINNELVGFFRADPPQITGDGVSTISLLIENKNKNKPDRIGDITVNDDLTTFIKRQGYTLESILEKDKTINLSAKTGRLYGGYTEEMLPKVHPKLKDIMSRAGAVVEAPIIGFDLIIGDPTTDPMNQRWGIIECNSLPFIDLHYFALVGKPVNLAENIWDLWK